MSVKIMVVFMALVQTLWEASVAHVILDLKVKICNSQYKYEVLVIGKSFVDFKYRHCSCHSF